MPVTLEERKQRGKDPKAGALCLPKVLWGGEGEDRRSGLHSGGLGFQGGLPGPSDALSASQLIRSPRPLMPKGHKKTHLSFWEPRNHF